MGDKTMAKKSEYQKRDREYIACTYLRYEKLIVSGQGAECIDEEGNRLIDFTSGIGVNSLGFADDAWVDAVCRQAAALQHTSNLYYTGPQIDLAERLIQRTGMKKVFFAGSGAEANECAIKTARKYGNSRSQNRRNRIVTLINSFHGRTMAALTATGQEQYHKDFFPFVPGFDFCEGGNLDQMDALTGVDTCAVMLELVQGEGGVIPLSREFVQGCEKLCREKGILLMVDEVQTGVGRTGTLFAYEQYGIRPDLVTFAKGIGGGLPLGGVLFGERTESVLQPGDHGTTFGGNPVACAGALAVLNRMDAAFLRQVREKAALLRKKLSALPGVYDLSGLGLMIGFRVKNQESGQVVLRAMEEGVLLLTAKDKVRLLPPLVITRDQIEEGMNRLERALAAF